VNLDALNVTYFLKQPGISNSPGGKEQSYCHEGSET